MTNSSTSKPQKRNTDPLSSGLKAALVIGSLAASVVGARLVALKDATTTITSTKPAVVVYPAPQAQPGMSDTTSGSVPRILPVIPTVIVPAPMPISPITSTRSSR